MHPRRQPGRWLAAVAGCLTLAGLAAAPARAATTGTIPGSPLTIYADDNGRLQALFSGAASGEFYPGTLVPGNGGLTVALTAPQATQSTIFGLRGTPFNSVSTPTVAGDGSAASPWTLTTSFSASTSLRVDETVVYFNGATQFGVQYKVTDISPTGGSFNVRLYESADILPAGGYAASGFLTGAAPMRRVGGQGLYNGVGGSGSLLEIDPWSAFEEAYSATVDAAVGNTNPAAGLTNTIAAGVENRGVGVAAQWDLGTLTPSTPSPSRATAWFFSRTSALSLAAASATQTAGQNARVTVTARSNDGGPDSGRSVRYTIAGANPGSGAVTTGADGTAVISWLGAKVGTDTLTAFVDRDGNGTWDVNTEPRQIVTVTFAPPPPPVPGKSVVAQVVSGQVFIKLPAGGRARATGPSKGFVPFAGAANIPVGSQLDTSKGRIKLTSAADTAGKKTQKSDFYDGIFAVKQSVPKKKPKKAVALTTDIVLKGQLPRSQCAPLKGASAAAAKKKKKGPKAVLGKLWGSGKGKFRTTGTYSSATVRGTVWLTQDECDGTLTKVVRGTVLVRDFKRKKTVTVKAGHSYLARAQRASTKSRRK